MADTSVLAVPTPAALRAEVESSDGQPVFQRRVTALRQHLSAEDLTMAMLSTSNTQATPLDMGLAFTWRLRIMNKEPVSPKPIEGSSPTQPILDGQQTTCCVIGAGPAGAVLSFMLARQGIPVILLESHQDFDRDFRGDTLHPSILEVMDELGLADRLLQLPHTKWSQVAPPFAAGSGLRFDPHNLKTKFPYITMMPQTRFLTFLTSEAQRFPYEQGES
jgi:hypothetical protein